MASVIYNHALLAIASGDINLDDDTFKAMLVNGYTPDVDAHDFRNDVTGEITGDGYTAGGAATATTVTQDNANNRVEVAFASITWSAATITADGAVIYKSRGGASSADELVAFVDFGEDKSSTDGDFTVNFTPSLFLTAVAV